MKSRTCLLLSFVAIALLVPSVALAEPTTQDRAVAEALFREGRTLVDAGKVAEACPKFSESNKLDPKLGTLMYAATCHEQEGKTASAWIEFTEALALAQQQKQRDREKIAKERVSALEGKLSRLAVSVAAPAAKEMVVKLDGATLGPATFGVPLPIDPGEHTVEANAPGRKPFTTKVSVTADASTQKTDVPLLEVDAPPVLAKPAETAPPPVQAPKESNRKVLGYALGGVGVVALGIGTVFGFRAASQYGDANEHCGGRLCTQEGLDEHDSAIGSARVSTFAFAIGVVAAAAGVYFIFFDKPRTGGAAAKTTLTPWGMTF